MSLSFNIYFRVTCQCIAILSGMSELRSHKLETEVLGQKELTNCVLQYAIEPQESVSLTDHIHNEELANKHLEYSTKSDHVVNVAGILLPVYDAQQRVDKNLVLVKSTQDNLRSLALAVATGTINFSL